MPDGNETQLPRRTFEGFEPWGTGCLRKTKSTVCTKQDQLPPTSQSWILPATGLRAGFLGAITSGSCPRLSTSGSLLCFSTRKCKYQQKPIITSPFVCAASLPLTGLFFSHCVLTPPPSKKRQRGSHPLAPGSVMSLETNHLSNKQELPVFLKKKKKQKKKKQTSLNNTSEVLSP